MAIAQLLERPLGPLWRVARFVQRTALAPTRNMVKIIVNVEPDQRKHSM